MNIKQFLATYLPVLLIIITVVDMILLEFMSVGEFRVITQASKIWRHTDKQGLFNI